MRMIIIVLSFGLVIGLVVVLFPSLTPEYVDDGKNAHRDEGASSEKQPWSHTFFDII